MSKRIAIVLCCVSVILITVLIGVFKPGPHPVSASNTPSTTTAPSTGTIPLTPFVAVKRGPMVRTIRIGGTLAAVQFSGVAAPAIRGQRFQMTLVRIAPAGTYVKPGDIVAEFDRQQQKQNYDDHEAAYNSQNDSIVKRRAELKIDREKQLSDLQKAQAALEAAKLEVRRNEVLSKIDAEKNDQALAEAQADLKAQQETLDLKKASADAEIKVLEIQRDREKLAMEQARINFERLVVKARVEGMVVLVPFWRGSGMGTAQEGDTTWPGNVFMQIVDTSKMAMRSRVNQLDVKYLKIGGPAEVHLDAYPDLRLTGRVETISPLGQNGSFGDKIRQFSVTISIQGNDRRLIPDISASADVELDRVPDALLVPRTAVARQGAGDFVWVQNAGGLERRQVTLGNYDDFHWAVTSGLRDGETVASVAPDQGAGIRPGVKPEGKPEAR